MLEIFWDLIIDINMAGHYWAAATFRMPSARFSACFRLPTACFVARIYVTATNEKIVLFGD